MHLAAPALVVLLSGATVDRLAPSSDARDPRPAATAIRPTAPASELLREEDGSVSFDAARLAQLAPPPAAALRTEDEARVRATVCARAACERLGIDGDTLVFERSTFLPLALVGSTDKVAVRFRQVVEGVPVEGGLSVLLGTRGALLDVVSTAAAVAELPPAAPLVVAEAAARTARDAFEARTGRAGKVLASAHLLFARDPARPTDARRLVWTQVVQSLAEGPEPDVYEVRVDARSGAVLAFVDRVLRFDVTGRVGAWITPGILPDDLAHAAIPQTTCSPCSTGTCGACPPTSCATPASSGDPSAEVPSVLADLELEDEFGNVVWTDADGTFRFPGSAPRTITARFRGRHAVVRNEAGPDYALTTTVTNDAGNRILLGGPAPYSGGPTLTAQANAYWWTTRLRHWIAEVNPADAAWESDGYAKLTRVNLAQTVNGCDARFVPTSALPGGVGSPETWFSIGGGACGLFPIQPAGCGCCGAFDGACTNKANATVLVHELGHWMNDLDFGIEAPSAFNEGLADVWATYVTGQPELFPYFCSAETCARSGETCRQYASYADQFLGDPHKKGEVVLGALWQVRARLVAVHGATTGASIANALFRAWCSTYPEFAIHPGIKRRWLVLDDDDANPLTPTPHQQELLGGFEAHGL